MEGTRHEKVAIVIATYVIGFTTAFIAFGIDKMATTSGASLDVENLAAQTLTNEDDDYKKIHTNIGSITLGDDGLYANIGGYKRILSAKINEQSASAILSTKTQGFHKAIDGASLSKDGWFVFFCEQTVASGDECLPYVYSLYDDTVYTVTLDGVHTALTVGEFTVEWSDDNYLFINGYNSQSNSTPWKFVSEEASETQ